MVVLGIFFITKKIKGNQETLFVSDAYPSDVVYFGLQHFITIKLALSSPSAIM